MRIDFQERIMMSKKIIFISHISQESQLAAYIKTFIDKQFMELFDVFVSSDGASIAAGARWLEEITNALEASVVQLSLCSPESIKRPWVNFEAGASWIRKIPVVPICHSGLRKNELPIPLSLLQSCDINNASDLQCLFDSLAKEIDAKAPSIDFAIFIDKCSMIAKNYSLRYGMHKSISKISKFLPDVSKCLMEGTPGSISFNCQDVFLKDFNESIKIFLDNQYVSLSSGDTIFMGKIENMFSQEIQLTLLRAYEPVRSEIFQVKQSSYE